MIVTLDFETEPITTPNLPPKPVGVALKINSEPAFYLAWGHPTENNCSFEKAREILESLWRDIASGSIELLMHNAKFDLSVMKKWFGLDFPSTLHIHDTLLLAFLCFPYEAQLSLKPLSEKLLGIPPEERDRVVEWIIENLRRPDGGKYSKSPKSENYAGAMIGSAPGELVGEYAVGDVDRTYKLFVNLYEIVKSKGMEGAYQRELSLLPILSANEQSGMRINMEKAEEKYEACIVAAASIDDWICTKLGVPELNITSGVQLGVALQSAGILDSSKLLRTDKGAVSYDKDSLGVALPPIWNSLIKYRRQLATTAGTFMDSWIEMGKKTNGIVYTSWNQVAQDRGGKGVGTRTGRLSSTPSFLNIPKVGSEDPPKELIEFTGISLPPIPFVRSLVIPWEPGWVLIDRDYSQQEVRIAAHCGGGNIRDEYLSDPWMDIHKHTEDSLATHHGLKLQRKHVKAVNFSMFYGGGVRRLMEVLGLPEEKKAVAEQVRNAVLSVNSGLAGMFSETERRAREGKPIRTWGGRLYYCEPSQYDTPNRKAYAYKLVNYLIQGSAADNLKEVWRRLGIDPSWFRTYVTVHDQFLASVPEEMIHDGHERLRSAMENIEFKVPMKSEGKLSDKDWAHMEDYDVKGSIVHRRRGIEEGL